ncbi:hypothetical protein AK88_04282 [Plasmodium fragile]|uniref:Uncharacterized protein n=1 Tax=Plasmodium fragile TaxID=5857 RepID=A0A0D9QK59_PLAFR|nr:uncharacterized protein AK88_04282 [Plasmodium fragile]KJP86091.1 hypothetical protein AK88_04282 [Plasmodium fragile]
MVANEDNVVSGQRNLGQRGNIPSVEMKKDALKKWVAQQHRQLNVHRHEEWFKHLLEHIEEETESHKGEVPVIDKDLEVEKAMAAADMLRVRDVQRSQQLHRQPYMNQRFTAKTWILILALVIEQCAVERRLQETELYVDALLQQC